MKPFRSLLILFMLTFSHSLFAIEEELKEAYKLYKQGVYLPAIDELNKIQSDKLAPVISYWKGVCYNRLLKFDEAIKSFEEAIALKNSSEDLNYEYGQALYAANDLEKSRLAFYESYKKNYRPETSLYYMGHISQILEEFPKAKSYYSKIIKDGLGDEKIQQTAHFQLGEVFLAMAEGKESEKEIKRLVQKFVIPEMEKGIKIAPTTPIAGEIIRRIEEIKNRFGLDPLVMKNGKRMSPKALTLRATQNVEYDSNITQATDLPSSKATQEDSYIFNTQFYWKYRMLFAQRVVSSPEVRLTNIKHANQDSSLVYKNDSYSVAPALKNSYEHRFLGKQASLLFDLDHNYTARDRESKHEKIFYGRSTTLTFGQKVKFFSVGDTTFKYKQKGYTAYSTTLDSSTNTFTMDQAIIFPKLGHLMLLLFSYDQTVMDVTTNDNTDSYLFRVDYIIPSLLHGFSFNAGFAYTVLDTLAQKETRGTEKMYNPSLKLTKETVKNLKYSVSYSYTKNTSLDTTNYAYTKHTTGFELEWEY